MKKEDYIAYLYSEGWKISDLKKLNDFSDFKIWEEFISFCKTYNINYLVWIYKFKKTKPSPYIVYYMGNIDLLNKYIIWIVWPRKINFFIRKALNDFFDLIKGKEVVIISWLAMWTDEYAHNLSLKFSLPTIAVLGMGFERALNSNLKEKILKIVKNNWLVISEFRLSQEGTIWTFPQRNRIIAWLSDFIFVPQAPAKSWTMITVGKAIEYGIPVYSCFSSYDDEMWKWTNKLIFNWKINGVVDISEFVESLWLGSNLNVSNVDLSTEEKEILDYIKQGYSSLDLLISITWKSIQDLINILSSLELKWLILDEVGEYKVK